MVIVDEVRISVVEPLMIRDMRVRRMDPDPFGDDLVERPVRLYQVVIDQAGANLIAREDAVLELFVQTAGVVRTFGRDLSGHDRPISSRA